MADASLISRASMLSKLILATLCTSTYLVSTVGADAFIRPSKSMTGTIPAVSSTSGSLSLSFTNEKIAIKRMRANEYLFNIRGGADNSQEQAEALSESAEEEKDTNESINEGADSDANSSSNNSNGTNEIDPESEYDSDYEDEEEETEEGDEEEPAASIGVEVMIQEDSVCIESEQNQDLLTMIETIQHKALQLRSKGKEFHDAGDFAKACDTFQQAATELKGAISTVRGLLQESGPGVQSSDADLSKQLTEDMATCRLHEALCHLKNKKYAETVASCTDVLMDGVEVIEMADNENDDIDAESLDSDDSDHTVTIRISPSEDQTSSAAADSSQLSPAVRARAYHRRAKARLALGDSAGALDDSRSAAFLGDRKAVALYGRLMRESSASAGTGASSSLFDGGDSGMGGLFGPSSSSSSPFDSIFSGSPLFSEDASKPSSNLSSMNMMSALLNSGSTGSDNSSAAPTMPFNPLSMLGSMGATNSDNADGDVGMGNLAKSVLSSVAKKAEDKDMQETVCKYLNALDATQIISLSTMAGMQCSQSTADRIASFANGITPRGISKSVKLTKRILFIGALMRKIFKIIGKYKHLLILVVLIGWTKSAIQRPVVLSKKATRKAAEAVISKGSFLI